MAKAATGAEPRKHHFVPQFYLRNFVDEKGMLLVTDRQSGKPFRTKPQGVAGQRDFNRIDVEGVDPNAIEKVLSEFEGEIAPHLERVIAATSITDEKDRAAIVNLMAALTLRNPKRRKEMGGVIERAARGLLGRKSEYGRYVEEMKAAGKWDGNQAFTHEELQRELDDANLKPSKESIAGAEIDHHDRVAEHLWKRKWQLVKAADNSGGFVTTDDPVAIRWTDGTDHGGNRPGTAESNSEIIFPLSTNLVLRGKYEGDEGTVQADAATVAGINSHIISNAGNQVYAYDHAFKFARGEPQVLRSGATLAQDEGFQFSGKSSEDDKVVILKAQ